MLPNIDGIISVKNVAKLSPKFVMKSPILPKPDAIISKNDWNAVAAPSSPNADNNVAPMLPIVANASPMRFGIADNTLPIALKRFVNTPPISPDASDSKTPATLCITLNTVVNRVPTLLAAPASKSIKPCTAVPSTVPMRLLPASKMPVTVLIKLLNASASSSSPNAFKMLAPKSPTSDRICDGNS